MLNCKQIDECLQHFIPYLFKIDNLCEENVAIYDDD